MPASPNVAGDESSSPTGASPPGSGSREPLAHYRGTWLVTAAEADRYTGPRVGGGGSAAGIDDPVHRTFAADDDFVGYSQRPPRPPGPGGLLPRRPEAG